MSNKTYQIVQSADFETDKGRKSVMLQMRSVPRMELYSLAAIPFSQRGGDWVRCCSLAEMELARRSDRGTKYLTILCTIISTLIGAAAVIVGAYLQAK